MAVTGHAKDARRARGVDDAGPRRARTRTWKRQDGILPAAQVAHEALLTALPRRNPFNALETQSECHRRHMIYQLQSINSHAVRPNLRCVFYICSEYFSAPRAGRCIILYLHVIWPKLTYFARATAPEFPMSVKGAPSLPACVARTSEGSPADPSRPAWTILFASTEI